MSQEASGREVDHDGLADTLAALTEWLDEAAEPDLHPVRGQLEQLHIGLGTVLGGEHPPTPQQSEQLRAEVRAVLHNDLAPVEEQLRQLGARLDQIVAVIGPLHDRMELLHEEALAHNAPLDQMRRGLTATQEIVTELAARADRSGEATQELTAAQGAALARLTAAANGLSSSLGSLRAAISTAVTAGGQATVDAIEGHLEAGLGNAVADVGEIVDARLRAQLGELGVSQLRVSMAELVQQVVETRADDRALSEVIRSVAQRVGHLGDDGPKLRSALGDLHRQLAAFPAVDLRPVSEQLARLSAVVVSQVRPGTETSSDVGALSRALDEATQVIADEVGRQTDVLTEVWAQLARLPSAAERTDDLRHEIGRATSGLRATLERVAGEITLVRDALDRPAASRWRRGEDDDNPIAPEVTAKKVTAKKVTAKKRPLRPT